MGIPKVRRVAIHIVPQLPPQNSGVGDYATLVGRRMEEIGDVTCGYVAAGVNGVALPNDGKNVRNITGRCEPEALWHAVDELAGVVEPSPSPSLGGRGILESNTNHRQDATGALTLILHYSGYGYDRNGAPAWLVDALRQRSMERAAHVVSYFHELYATGRPWQRAFWYSAATPSGKRDSATKRCRNYQSGAKCPLVGRANRPIGSQCPQSARAVEHWRTGPSAGFRFPAGAGSPSVTPA